jgi:predicted extracellular nuclease
MNTLFDDTNALVEDETWSARYNITKAQQINALGVVFQALNADAILVVEAPDSSSKRDGAAALRAFAKRFGLRTREALVGFPNDTQQEIALLYDPDVVSVLHDPKGAVSGDAGLSNAPRFDGVFRIDLDIDGREDLVRFSKPPLEVSLTAGELDIRFIGAHLKSKAPHGARTEADAIQQSIANRRKQLAQAIWLRQRIDAHLSADEPVIVAGDLNDGPGLDAYENLFGRSSVEIVMGNDLHDPFAVGVLARRSAAQPSTARFWMREEKRYFQALLDYIFVSKALRQRSCEWRIWHPFDDPDCFADQALRDALLLASDHFPVSLDIAI